MRILKNVSMMGIVLLTTFMVSLLAVNGEAAKKIAIMPFDNTANYRQAENLDEMIVDSLTSEIVKNKNYVVIERSAIRQVLNEQRFGATGVVEQSSAAQIGKLLGADYILFGSVNNAEVKAVSHLWTEYKFKVNVSMKLVDANTGELLIAEGADGKVVRSALGGGIGESADVSSAWSECAMKAVGNLAHKINQVNPMVGTVVQVDGETVYIDMGFNDGVREGDVYLVFREGRVIKHPVTGKIIGTERKELGKLKIQTVDATLSYGEFKSEKGDYIRIGDSIRK